MNQLYVYTYPLFFRFPSHLGHHRALSGVPCSIMNKTAMKILVQVFMNMFSFVGGGSRCHGVQLLGDKAGVCVVLF